MWALSLGWEDPLEKGMATHSSILVQRIPQRSLVGYSPVQFSCSVVSNSLRPCGLQHARLPCPSPTPELAQTHVHRVGDAIQTSCPLLPLPSIFPSIRVFSNESVLLIRWPKYWSFSISPSSEFSWLVSFRMDWLDLLAVQGTLKSLT